jgi:hypothetical protein
VYLLRVVDGDPEIIPRANIPTVLFPAAEPLKDAELAAVADALTQPEYVYLFRVVDAPGVAPRAKIPIVDVPTAAPREDAALAAVAEVLVHPEYVYLFLVVTPHGAATVAPRANIAKVPVATFPATGHTPAFCQDNIWSIVHMPGAVPH